MTTIVLSALTVGGAVRAEPSAVAETTAAQPPVQLSLAQAVKLALSRSPLSREAAARTAAAEAEVRSAKAIPNPILSLAHWAGHDTGGLDEDIILTQTFELGGKRGARISQARAERSAAASERVGTADDTVLSVKSAYYEALLADEDYQLSKETLDVAHQFAEAARTQYTAGDVPRSNVIRAEVEESRAEQDVTAAETERKNRYAALGSLVGVPETSKLQLTDKLEFSPVRYELPRLEALAVANRPDLHAAKSLVESAEAVVRLAKAQWRPDAFLEGRRASIDPAVEGASIRGGIIMPIFDFGRHRAEVAAAQAALQEQQAKLDEATRTARLEVETVYNNVVQAQKVVESFETGRLKRAKELLNMAEIGYAHGANSYLEVLDAQRVYRSEEADYSRALASYNTALATLERVVGGRLK